MSAKSLLLCERMILGLEHGHLWEGGKHYPVNLHKAYTVLYLEIAQRTATDTLKPEVRGGETEKM